MSLDVKNERVDLNGTPWRRIRRGFWGVKRSVGGEPCAAGSNAIKALEEYNFRGCLDESQSGCPGRNLVLEN